MDAKTILTAAAVSAVVAVGLPRLVTYVELQLSTPGTTQLGHSNISGYSLAGRFGANTSPTLARVQVLETGTLQGVRSETDSGVAVFGKSTAGTGLGAGGYFTTSSVGGRGIVGDALSGTGSTVGGLFYSRSTSGGTALWGKHIGSSGTTTGVFGEVDSTSGVALAASNTSTLDTGIEAAGPNGALYTKGDGLYHEYTSGSRAPAIPLAYGTFGTTGVVLMAGSGNWTATHTGTGTYAVNVAGIDLNTNSQFAAVATVFDASTPEVAFVSSDATASADFVIHVCDLAGTAVDSVTHFVVYAALPSTLSGPLSIPDGLKRYGDLERWEKADPKGFERWRQADVRRQREAMKAHGWTAPVETQYPRP